MSPTPKKRRPPTNAFNQGLMRFPHPSARVRKPLVGMSSVLSLSPWTPKHHTPKGLGRVQELVHKLNVVLGASQEQLHFRVALQEIHGARDCRHSRFTITSEPNIDPGTVAGGGAMQVPVIEWVDHVRVSWMPRTPRAINSDRVAAHELVARLPEVGTGDVHV